MASSVARMPADDWRHHAAGVLGAYLHTPKPVFTGIPTSIDKAVAAVCEPCSPATAVRLRQSQILDRWAARQAREMITTIERQTHEAELSALCTTTQPVSARAASFLRDTSPDSSATDGGGGGGGSGRGCAVSADIPLNVRASSLIQMWRELEAEAGLSQTPRSGAAPSASVAAEERSGGSDACDEAESFCDSDSTAAESDHPTERRRVGEIVRMLSLKICSSTASSDDEGEPLTVSAKDFPGKVPPPPARSLSPTATAAGKALQVIGRREMEGLIVKLEQERRREVAALAEGQPVSRFPFRGRIQSLIRLRSLRQEVAIIRHQQQSQKLEAERCQSGSNHLLLRSVGTSRHEVSEVSTNEGMRGMQVQSSDCHDCGCTNPADHSDCKSNQYPEMISTKNFEGSPQALYSPQAFFTPLTRHEDLQESQSPDASWDERCLWRSSLDWQRPPDSPILQSWHGEIATEGMDTSTQEQNVISNEFNWLSEPCASRRRWRMIRENFNHDLLNTNFTDNVEIRELLERKTVSTFLASDFCAKMNQMLISFLHRQEQYVDENDREECEEEGIWEQNYESNSDQEAIALSLTRSSSEMLQNQESWRSISLPLPFHMLQYQKSWKSTSFSQNSSTSLQEGMVMHDLKNNIFQIQHEVSELKKLVESFLEWQKKLECSIKQEVSSTVDQLCGTGKLMKDFSWMPGRKDTCCICCEAQVDSLFYRCGHMAACYNCAQELQGSSGRCPICRSMIVDVVRAYRNS